MLTLDHDVQNKSPPKTWQSTHRWNKDDVLNAGTEFNGGDVKGLSVGGRLTALEWYDRAVKKLELRTFSDPSPDPALVVSIPPPPEHLRTNHNRLLELKTAISALT